MDVDDDTIEQRISSLKLDLNDLGKKILQHINVIHSSIDNSNIDLKNDPRNCIRSLRYDIDDILEIASNRTEHLEEYSNDLKKCNILVNLLESVNITSDTISKLEDAIDTTDLNLISKLPLNTDIDPIYSEYCNGFSATTLRKEASIQRSRCIIKLKRLLNCFINLEHCSDGTLYVTSVLKHGGYTIAGEENEENAYRSGTNEQQHINLIDCWEACLELGIAEEAVTHICCQIWSQLIKPLWRVTRGSGTGSVSSTANNSTINPQVTKSIDSFDQSQSCLTIPCIHTLSNNNLPTSQSQSYVMNSNSNHNNTTNKNGSNYSDQLGVCGVPFPYLLDNIYAILHYISCEILCSNEKVCV